MSSMCTVPTPSMETSLVNTDPHGKDKLGRRDPLGRRDTLGMGPSTGITHLGNNLNGG